MEQELKHGSDGHEVPPAYADLAEELDTDEDDESSPATAYEDLRKSG